MFSVVVSLEVEAGMRNAFLDAIVANATASVREEPGCIRFDVVEDAARENGFLLYEVYSDGAAFEAHKTTPHYALWRAAATECLVAGSQTVQSGPLRHSTGS